MLLLVASFVESEDLVPIVDEVLDAAEAFLRDDPKLAFDDTAWLGRRGLTLLLTALFMAVEASRTDDDDASEELARDLVHSASSLATVRGSPGSPSTAGDVGAAADAFVFAKHAHRDGMATDHLSARSRAMEALRHMEDAYDMAMRETSIRATNRIRPSPRTSTRT
ncbi:hypothetical protein FNF28_05061 [Cafeteria roenbergensis]|uniref:Uncharacterized protein n=1 Tax=Cafeteria roenbergensis TaxID=33653 RepID=A0A5A8D8D3_CAFRO|nr:hypothetical protein FNF28_05061 [Cafeteria roenbergensis]